MRIDKSNKFDTDSQIYRIEVYQDEIAKLPKEDFQTVQFLLRPETPLWMQLMGLAYLAKVLETDSVNSSW